MRILLTGGTGLIGQALCRRWAAQGHELLVWSREPAKVAGLCSGARGIAALQEIDGLALDAVVNLAGAPIADRLWTEARRALLWESRVYLTRELVSWMGRQPQMPAVLISGSAIGWYGDSGDALLSEDSPAGHDDYASELCFAWEQAAMEAEEYGIRVCCVRTGLVLSTDGGMLARMLPAFRLGLGGRLGDGLQWMSWIHIEDQVRLIEHLMLNLECQGPYNACAPGPVRNSDFARTLAQALHRPALLPAPSVVLRTLLGELSTLLLGSQRVSSQKVQDSGFEFHYTDLAPALDSLLGAADKESA